MVARIDAHFFRDGGHVVLRVDRADIVADPANMLDEWLIINWIN